MNLQEQLEQRINSKTKPLGALGKLESLAIQIGLIQQSTTPFISNPHILVFAGDHGIAATGLVNPYPQAVTAQMVMNFVQGGAAINVFTRQHGLALKVIDAGVNADLSTVRHPALLHHKIAYGTANYLEAPAMSGQQVQEALQKGKDLATQLAAGNCNCMGIGEMGIGNTSSAALILSAITGKPIQDCTGRGTGVNDAQLAQKVETLRKVHEHHQLAALADKPLELLAAVGGLEIAMMTGACLGAAANRMILVIDGFIATAALMIAKLMNPDVQQFCVFAHHSGEQGHTQMLTWLKASPLLQLDMRLGEGTGAALAIPLLQSAVAFLEEMASFESAGISGKPVD